MLFSNEDFNYLLSSLKNKFSLYEFIDDNYLSDLLTSLRDTGCFEELKISNDELNKDMNPLFYISFKVQNYLYFKICSLCEEDIDVLLTLIEDKKRVVNLVLRKLKVADVSNIDDYIMNVTSLYKGVESFDSFLTRYIMAKVKNVPFELEKPPTVVISSLEDNDSDKGKKKKKKEKKKKQFNCSVPAQKVKSLYEVCLEKCNDSLGTGIKDNFINMVLLSSLVNEIEFVTDERYKVYFLMRFGLMNNSYYTREEIVNILGIEERELLLFEKETIKKVRDYYNSLVNCYEKYLLEK